MDKKAHTMKIEKLIKILDAEERSKLSLELLQDSKFNLRAYLRERIAIAQARIFDAEMRRILYGDGVSPIPSRMLRGKSVVQSAFDELATIKKQRRCTNCDSMLKGGLCQNYGCE